MEITQHYEEPQETEETEKTSIKPIEAEPILEAIVAKDDGRRFNDEEFQNLILTADSMFIHDKYSISQETFDSIRKEMHKKNDGKPAERQGWGIEDAYRLTATRDIPKEYVDKALDKCYPSLEQQLEDIKKFDAKTSERLRVAKSRQIAQQAYGDYISLIKKQFKIAMPFEAIDVKLQTYKARFFENTQAARIRVYLVKPRKFLFFKTRKKELIAEIRLAGRAGRRGHASLAKCHDITAFSPMFLRICGEAINEFSCKYGQKAEIVQDYLI